LITLLLVPVPAYAETNLTATWKMNIQGSYFGYLEDSGTLFGPKEITQISEQSSSMIIVELIQKVSSGEIWSKPTYITDGSECNNELEGYTLTSRVTWKDNNLVFKNSLAIDPYNPDFLDRWILSDDGKKLTINWRLESLSGPSEVGVLQAGLRIFSITSRAWEQMESPTHRRNSEW
jgi:hypothetical protein